MKRHCLAFAALSTVMATIAGGLGACSNNKLETAGSNNTAGAGAGIGKTPATGGGGRAALPCGTSAPAALGACVEESRYLKDLTTVEGVRPTRHQRRAEQLYPAAREQGSDQG